jgi:signal transduction histidine kinase
MYLCIPDRFLHIHNRWSFPFIYLRRRKMLESSQHVAQSQKRPEEIRWNIHWPLRQSRGTRVKLASTLWYGIALLTLVALYIITGRLGLSLGAVSGFATLVWLPSGLSVAVLFLWGYRFWPAITLGAFLVNLFTGAPWFVALGISIGNTLEAVVTTALLKREKVGPGLDSLHDVLVLVLLATPIGAIISATLGVGSLLLGHVIVWPLVFETWKAWWLGDMASLLLLTPLLLTWSTWPQAIASRKQWLELSLLSLFLLAAGIFVFLRQLHPDYREYPVTHLIFLPLTWAALRFGSRGATAALALISGLAIAGTIQGISPFSIGSLSLRLLFLQSFMAVTAITTLLMAAVMAERHTLERRKDAFISMASHELRTPLTCMKGYAQLLHKQLANTEHLRALRALTRIEMQIEQISRLIEDLLDLSKIQAGKLTFTDERVDVDAWAREVIEQFQQTTNHHQISLQGSAEGTLICDRERLSQVLNNLLTNAVKYSPQSEQINVHLTSTPQCLTVSVQDFGIGIPTTELQRVFQQFYRVAGRHERTAPGLGIGLSIAREIIEHYGGRLWVESVEGQGSTFSFSLPPIYPASHSSHGSQ